MEFFDPMCRRFATDMEELDYSWASCQEELDETPTDERRRRRERFVRNEEGTLNTTNGHFLCNKCYIEAGMPVRPGGWTCP